MELLPAIIIMSELKSLSMKAHHVWPSRHDDASGLTSKVLVK